MPSDEKSLHVSMRGCARPPEDARLVFIENTLILDDFYASPCLLPEIEAHPRLSVTGEVPLAFSEPGVMQSPWRLN